MFYTPRQDDLASYTYRGGGGAILLDLRVGTLLEEEEEEENRLDWQQLGYFLFRVNAETQ